MNPFVVADTHKVVDHNRVDIHKAVVGTRKVVADIPSAAVHSIPLVDILVEDIVDLVGDKSVDMVVVAAVVGMEAMEQVAYMLLEEPQEHFD